MTDDETDRWTVTIDAEAWVRRYFMTKKAIVLLVVVAVLALFLGALVVLPFVVVGIHGAALDVIGVERPWSRSTWLVLAGVLEAGLLAYFFLDPLMEDLREQHLTE